MSWNIGSVIEEVGRRVSNIPTNLSGTNMTGIVNESIYWVYNQTGINPGSVDIEDKYHKVIFCATAAGVTQAKMDDTDTFGAEKGYKIGDFSFQGDNVNGGNGSVLDTQYQKYMNCVKEQLKLLGFNIKTRKVNG